MLRQTPSSLLYSYRAFGSTYYITHIVRVCLTSYSMCMSSNTLRFVLFFSHLTRSGCCCCSAASFHHRIAVFSFSSFYFYISSALLIVYISCISLFSRILLFPLPSFLIILKRAHRHTQTLFSVAFATNSLSGTRRCVRECDTPSTQWNNSWQEWVDCNALHKGERKKKNCSTE